MSLMRTLTVGLVGPSATGKSALADALSKLLPSTIALAVVSADAHYRPLHHCPAFRPDEIRWHSGSMPDAFRERGAADLNHPAAVDWEACARALDAVIDEARGTTDVDRTTVVLVEGLLLLANDPGANALRGRVTAWALLADDPHDAACQRELWTRKWTRSGHLGKLSYRDRGVSEEDYEAYWRDYVAPSWALHGLGRAADAAPGAIQLDCLQPVHENARRLVDELILPNIGASAP